MLAGTVDTLMLSSVCDAAVGGSYLFGVTLKLGVFGVFICLALDEVLRAGFMIIRWRSGKWEGKVLVKAGESQAEEEGTANPNVNI